MTTTTDISLAKALKVKNRLAGRLARLDADLKKYNCTLEGSDRPDVPALYEARRALVDRLIELKAGISAANGPIQRAIYELAEAKALLKLLGELNTTHGKVVQPYQTAEAVYVAQLRQADVEREVRRLEAEADHLQDRIDAFNHQALIRVEADTLAAAGPRPADGG
jgi:hypothetical protein